MKYRENEKKYIERAVGTNSLSCCSECSDSSAPAVILRPNGQFNWLKFILRIALKPCSVISNPDVIDWLFLILRLINGSKSNSRQKTPS